MRAGVVACVGFSSGVRVRARTTHARGRARRTYPASCMGVDERNVRRERREREGQECGSRDITHPFVSVKWRGEEVRWGVCGGGRFE